MLSFHWQLLSIPLALIYENFLEWAIHKYALHGLGRDRASFWSFHWNDHHASARRNGFIDPSYQSHAFVWNARTKELAALIVGAILHLPVIWLSPLAYATLVA